MGNCQQNPNFFGFSQYRATHAQKLEKGVFSFDTRHPKLVFFLAEIFSKDSGNYILSACIMQVLAICVLTGFFLSEVGNKRFFRFFNVLWLLTVHIFVI